MKQLNDYKWLYNRYKIQDFILNNRTWKDISRRPLLEGFITQLVGVELLNHRKKIKLKSLKGGDKNE